MMGTWESRKVWVPNLKVPVLVIPRLAVEDASLVSVVGITELEFHVFEGILIPNDPE